MNVSTYYILIISLLVLSSCKKEPSQSLQLNTTSNKTLELRSSGPIDTLRLQKPSFDKLKIVMQSIQDHWSFTDYLATVEEFGYIHWNQAHVEMSETSDVEDYLISIPMIKHGKVTGIILHLYEDWVYLYDFIDAEVMSDPAQSIIFNNCLIDALLIASCFSHHQFFHNQHIGEYQTKLQEINTITGAFPRCVRVESRCHWICFGYECHSGYLHCYWVTTAKDCIRSGALIRQTGGFHPPKGGGGETGNEHSQDNSNFGNINWEPQDDCLTKAAPHLKNADANLEIGFPCDSRSPHDIVVGILERLCQDLGNSEFGNEVIDMAMLQEELVKYDKVEPKHMCSKAQCILDEILDIPVNEATCNVIHSFDASSTMHLIFYTSDMSDRQNLEEHPYGETITQKTFNPKDARQFHIFINEDLCSPGADPLRLAETLIHESIHAELYSIAMDGGWNGDPTDSTAFFEVWNIVAQEKYGGQTDHHKIMLDEYVHKVASSLRALNGNQHAVEDYYYIVYEGIPPSILAQNDIYNLDPFQYKYDLNVQMNSFSSNLNKCK